jgi:hypothetical protein
MKNAKYENHQQQNNPDKQMPAATSSQTSFGCTPKELKELMEIRGHEAVTRIRNKYGNVEELCRRLMVSASEGDLFFFLKFLFLSAVDDMDKRKYCRNQLDGVAPSPFDVCHLSTPTGQFWGRGVQRVWLEIQ